MSHVLDLSEVPCGGDPVRDGCNSPLRNAIMEVKVQVRRYGRCETLICEVISVKDVGSISV